MAARPGRNTTAYKTIVDNMRTQRQQPCHLCKQRIDYDAPANTDNAFEADHLHPLSTHPHLADDPTNLKPSHHKCNRSRRDTPIAAGNWHRTEL